MNITVQIDIMAKSLIGSVDTLKELNSKKLQWMHRLKTCAPYGFNEAF